MKTLGTVKPNSCSIEIAINAILAAGIFLSSNPVRAETIEYEPSSTYSTSSDFIQPDNDWTAEDILERRDIIRKRSAVALSPFSLFYLLSAMHAVQRGEVPAAICFTAVAVCIPLYSAKNLAESYKLYAFGKLLNQALAKTDSLFYELEELQPQLIRLVPGENRRNFCREGICVKIARVALPLLLHVMYPFSKPQPRDAFFRAWFEEPEDWELAFDRFSKTAEGRDWITRFTQATHEFRDAVRRFMDYALPVKTFTPDEIEHALAKRDKRFRQMDGTVYYVRGLRQTELVEREDGMYALDSERSQHQARDDYFRHLENCEFLIARYR